MKKSTLSPPKLALFLLEIALPKQMTDEIIGDLYEEFTNKDLPVYKRHIWFWWHTIAVITRLSTHRLNMLAVASTLFSIVIFVMLSIAMLFISNAVDDDIFAKSYWTDGSIHLFFTEQAYWQQFYTAVHDFNVQLFINVPAMIWSAISLATLITVHKKRLCAPLYFVGLSLLLLITPYLYGVFVFITNDVALRQSGPIIAIMWLSIWYMIVPVCYLINRQFKQQIDLFE